MILLIPLFLLSSGQFVRIPQKGTPPAITTNRVWVFFTDKNIFTEAQYQRALNITQQSKTGASGGDYHNFTDLPVRNDYVRKIEALGARRRTVSHWLNAASFDLPPELVPVVYRLPFVYDIRPVGKRTELKEEPAIPINQPRPLQHRAIDTAEAHRFYGAAWDQAQMLGVPEVFFKGYYGSGVKLALFDTGIKLKHQAVKRLKITRQYDFLSGDNFYIASTNLPPAVIPSLRYLNMVHSPALTLAQNKIILTFVADSFNYLSGLPTRALFASSSSDQGATWTSPAPLLISRPYYYTYENLQLISRDSVTYLAFNELGLLPGIAPVCYLGHFIHGAWQNKQPLGNGRAPAMAVFADTLYIAYITTESLITLKKAAITQPAPNWLLHTTFSGRHPLTQLAITAGPAGTINIYALDNNSAGIQHFHSTDGGNTFNPLPELTAISPRLIRLLNHPTADSVKLLFFLDDGTPPLTRLLLTISTDYGSTWRTPATVDSALTIGDYAANFSPPTTLKLVYESAGFLYQKNSPDLGTTWQNDDAIDTTGFCFAPNLILLDNNRLGYIWCRRGDETAIWEESDTAKFSREQPNHGTRMASLIAGYQPYSMMGIAPGVDLLIARTEFYKTASGRYYEYNMEEDTYIQALEWAARCGADVISTSLGYRDFYRDDQFDGKTIPVSIAASTAARKGLLIVTAMGNRDTTTHPWPRPYVVAPGDAEGVITCGGVQKNLLPWRGTGTGPTADGRIKPDLVALADTVAVVAPDSENLLEGSAGTSCATALIAGCCALLKEAHPDWNADSITEVLFATASRAVKSCTFGFGVPQIDSAFKLFPPVPQAPPISHDQISTVFPNPFILTNAPRVYFAFNLTRVTPSASITIYTPSGVPIKTINLNTAEMSQPGRYRDVAVLEKIGAYWDGKNENGRPAASGLYLAVLQTTFGSDVAKFSLLRQP